MKTIIFTFAVLAAAGYLTYNQLPEVRQMVDSSIRDDQQYPANSAILEASIARLEAEVVRLKNRHRPSIVCETDDSVAGIKDLPSAPTIDIKERSDALLELANRMELKALGQ